MFKPITGYQAAMNDFHAAHLQGALQQVLAHLNGKSNQLLSYEHVAARLRLRTSVERGIQTIPIDAIVGSVGRYNDFTRTFLPKHTEDSER